MLDKQNRTELRDNYPLVKYGSEGAGVTTAAILRAYVVTTQPVHSDTCSAVVPAAVPIREVPGRVHHRSPHPPPP